jgi:hypothetical protein
MQVMPLENGLTRVLDLASKLWALYDSESGGFTRASTSPNCFLIQQRHLTGLDRSRIFQASSV